MHKKLNLEYFSKAVYKMMKRLLKNLPVANSRIIFRTTVTQPSPVKENLVENIHLCRLIESLASRVSNKNIFSPSYKIRIVSN